MVADGQFPNIAQKGKEMMVSMIGIFKLNMWIWKHCRFLFSNAAVKFKPETGLTVSFLRLFLSWRGRETAIEYTCRHLHKNYTELWHKCLLHLFKYFLHGMCVWLDSRIFIRRVLCDMGHFSLDNTIIFDSFPKMCLLLKEIHSLFQRVVRSVKPCWYWEPILSLQSPLNYNGKKCGDFLQGECSYLHTEGRIAPSEQRRRQTVGQWMRSSHKTG